MSVPIYQRTATTGTGDIIPNAEYTVINEGTGTGQTIYSNRAGTSVKSPPYYADGTGLIQFYIAPGVTFRVAATDGANTYTDRYVYAAYAQETSDDTGAGQLMEVGAFGLGVDFQGDGNGAVGIGTTSPSRTIELRAAVPGIQFTDSDSNSYGEIISIDGSFIIRSDEGNASGNSFIRFEIDGSEKVRLDNNGDLFVGKTSTTESVEGIELRADGQLKAIVSSNYAATFRRNDTSGPIVEFLYDSSTAGHIGVRNADPYFVNTEGSGTGIKLDGGNSCINPVNTDGSNRDNAVDIGYVSARFQDIYATNNVINTSDRNEKQDILEITTAETAVARACKSLLRSFRWKSAVAEKGDNARIHFGIIAQDLQDAFTAEGLDAGRYAMFISGTWWEAQTEVEAVEAVEGVEFVQAIEASEALYSEDGELVSEAVEAVEGVEGVEAVEAKDAYTRTDTFETLAEAPPGATERTRLGVRYSELLAFIIAAL